MKRIHARRIETTYPMNVRDQLHPILYPVASPLNAPNNIG